MTFRAARERLSTAAHLMAVGAFVVGLLLWASGAFMIFTDVDRYPWFGKLGILIAAFVIQVWAQHRPGPALAAMCVLIAADAAMGPSLPPWIALSDVLYLCAVGGSESLRRIAIGFGVAVTAGGAVAGFVADGARLGVLVGLLGIALLLSPIGYAQSVVATRRAAEAQKAAAVSQAAADRSAALADERRRVSRELHDTVAGHVSAIAILSEAAKGAADPAPVVESIRANSLAALGELRAMIDVLAADGDDLATVRWTSLQPLIDAADAVGSTVTVTGDPAALPRHVETVASRIVGEALANATRHAPGRPVRVDVVDAADAVRVAVRNDLVGTAPPATRTAIGRGVPNMRIRAESIGGRVEAGPVGREWIVTAELPR